MPVPATDPPAGALDAAARLADRLRWFFLPLALCALVAVGVHTAADVVGEIILRMVDATDAAFDALVSQWTLTAPLVDLVGPSQRIFFARAVALLWELAADALLALVRADARSDGIPFRRARAFTVGLPGALLLFPLALAALRAAPLLSFLR